jgi:large subunit ribosomal protein L18
MSKIAQTRIKIRKSRKKRIRRLISGTGQKPRLNVRRSLNHIYAQLIDDESGSAILQLSSLNKEIEEKSRGKSKVEVSREVGKKIGGMTLEKGINMAVFDRGGYLYHGRIKALAEGAREAGLKF